MFDYKLLEALAVVIKMQGFEKAAEQLFITQSAISQRIKLLEEQSGQILITRQTPPIPTEYGKKLIQHYEQVSLLEDELLHDGGNSNPVSSVRIGVNTDSLATWFFFAMKPFLQKHEILLDLRVDDQDETRNMLINGEVAGCVSSSPVPVQGCSVSRLGKMDYVLVCTESFFSRRFKHGFTKDGALRAQAVLFNSKDKLHERFLKNLFGIEDCRFPAHYIPSLDKFLEIIMMDLAYGVIPLFQFEEQKKGSSLIQLTEQRVSVDLYWHHWNINSKIIKNLNAAVINFGKKHLG